MASNKAREEINIAVKEAKLTKEVRLRNFLVSNVLECADKSFTTEDQKSACENKFTNRIDS